MMLRPALNLQPWTAPVASSATLCPRC